MKSNTPPLYIADIHNYFSMSGSLTPLATTRLSQAKLKVQLHICMNMNMNMNRYI